MIPRGVKTLGVRVRQQSSSAQTIAEKLERHPAVAKVYFPGLRSHAGYTLAKQQMRGPGAMISMEIVGGLSAATNFLRRLGSLQVAPKALEEWSPWRSTPRE